MSAADDPEIPRAPTEMPRADPMRIGRYEIRRERGRGAMGVVYEAHDPILGRRIALKTIRLPFAASAAELEAFEKRFFAEAQIAARLSHPGIVVVHDAARDPETGTLYMALEYLEGRTLAEIVVGGVALSWREALRITARIAVALHHAHASGVVHRDIKPSNIMLLADGDPKILDFGIAKAEAAQINLTLAGQLLGTPLYRSPEQTLGLKVDARSDIFSLGAIAYSLLTGEHAFAAANATKIVARVIEDQPSPPSAFVPGLPSDVDHLVRRAMAKEPEGRYPDGNAMARDIENVLADQPLHRHAWQAAGVSTAAAGAADPRESLKSPDLEAESDTLFGRAAPPPSGTPPSPTPSPVGATGPMPASLSPARRASGGLPHLARFAAAAAVLLVVITLAAGVFLLTKRKEGPTAGPATEPSPPLPTSVPDSPQPEVTPRMEASAGPDPSPAPDRLALPNDAAPEQGALATAEPSTPAPSPLALETPGRPLAESPSSGPLPLPTMPASASVTEPQAAPASQLARLNIEVEHPLKSGTLRVWLDTTLILAEKLDDQVDKSFLPFSLHKGSFQKAVVPGRYGVTVEVQWEDTRRMKHIAGTLKAGASRRLKVRLARSKKDLSLEWD